MLKIMKTHKFIFGLFIFSFIIRLLTILFIKTPIFSDFETMYNASKEIINGTNYYKDTTYFVTWGYQMGHVMYQALLLKIWNNILFLKLINTIVTSFIPVFIYLISKKVSNEKSSRIVSILYSLFPFPLLLNTVLTNQHLSLLLNMIGIYVLLNMNDKNSIWKKSMLIGMIFGLGNILRSEGIVILTALFLYYIYLVLKKHNIKKLVTSFLIIFISYILIFQLTSFLLIQFDLSKNGLKNMNPTWKFVAGFNYETNGVYDVIDASLYSGYNQVDDAKEELKNRITNYKKIPDLFVKKTKILWFNSDLSWSIGYMSHDYPTIYKIATSLNQVWIILVNILLILSFIKFIKFKNITDTQILLMLIVLVYFGVYLLIEVMPRYAYGFGPFIFILAAIPFEYKLKNISFKRFK